MGVFQSGISGIVGSGLKLGLSSAAKKIAKKEQSAKVDFTELNAQSDFLKANKALVNELTRKKISLEREKNMLEKLGKWDDKKEKSLGYLNKQIEIYSKASSEVSKRYDETIKKLGGE